MASDAGLGWRDEYESLLPLVTSEGFDEALAWVEANPGPLAANMGYVFSKKATDARVAGRVPSMLSERGIRLNNTGPARFTDQL